MTPIWGPLGAADLAETVVARPDGYVVPKPRHAADVREIAQALERLEQRHGVPHGPTPLPLIPTQTPEGPLNTPDGAPPPPPALAHSSGLQRPGPARGPGRRPHPSSRPTPT